MDNRWNYGHIGDLRCEVHIHAKDMDVTGGRIKKEDIDELKKYPNIKSVVFSGLNQETFEYFIKNYGQQFIVIDFFKNKFVEDWSLLSTLPQLECIRFFHNQRITKLWDMSHNMSLKLLWIEDFTRLHCLDGIETAPHLEYFDIGNAVWDKAEIDTYQCFRNTNIKYLRFSGKTIIDKDMSFIQDMPKLEVFDFPSNLLSSEQVAWITGHFPKLQGYCLKPVIEYDDEVLVVGKRKPLIKKIGNEKRINQYINKFKEYEQKYKNVNFTDV